MAKKKAPKKDPNAGSVESNRKKTTREHRGDFEPIEQAIAAATNAAFTEVMQQHPDDRFFAFALSTLDDADCVGASVNSVENHQAIVNRQGLDTPSPEEEYVRWTPCEWGDFEYVGSGYFEAVDQLLATKYDELSENHFESYRQGVIDSMQRALAMLDSKGFWGFGKAREQITLFVTVYDSESAEAVEDQSAKALNPPPVYTQFRRRFAETRRKDRESKNRKQELQAQVASLSVAEQVRHWIAELKRITDEAPPDDPIEEMRAPELALDSLAKLGQPAIIPMLDFIQMTMQNDETHVDSLRSSVLRTVSMTSESDSQVHAKLSQVLERFCQHNAGRKLWQITPFHIAMCIYKLFDGYPMPSMEGHSALRNYQEFIALTKE